MPARNRLTSSISCSRDIPFGSSSISPSSFLIFYSGHSTVAVVHREHPQPRHKYPPPAQRQPTGRSGRSDGLPAGGSGATEAWWERAFRFRRDAGGQRNRPIPRAVDPDYMWGDALVELRDQRPDLRIINLEISVTTSNDPAPKGINYRMNPATSGACSRLTSTAACWPTTMCLTGAKKVSRDAERPGAGRRLRAVPGRSRPHVLRARPSRERHASRPRDDAAADQLLQA
jgi:hypothetical protein